MSSRLNGQSLFTGINSGLTNTFSQLSNLYTDGLTLENLNSSLSNTNVVNGTYGTTFASYLTSNFSSIDKDNDGKISSSEIQTLMNNIAQQGLTRDQISSLGSTAGMSTSLQETVLNHFDDIDTNHDGKVTNAEIQAYGVQSDIENQKISDTNRLINNMSLFYESDEKYEGSIMDYKWISNDNNSSSSSSSSSSNS